MQQLLLAVYSRGQLGNSDSPQHEVPFFLLSKFLYIIGHIAIKQMVHLDTSVYKELKRRDNIRKLRKKRVRMRKRITKGLRGSRTQALRRTVRGRYFAIKRYETCNGHTLACKSIR